MSQPQSRLICKFGKPCNYFCSGRFNKHCYHVNDSVLEQIVEAVEEAETGEDKPTAKKKEEA